MCAEQAIPQQSADRMSGNRAEASERLAAATPDCGQTAANQSIGRSNQLPSSIPTYVGWRLCSAAAYLLRQQHRRMDPKQQGLSVMLTNALRSNAAFELERNTSLAKSRQAVILPIGRRGTGFAGQTVRETDQVNLGQVALAAQHPVVEISPRQSVRRRMVSAPGMTVELVQETGSERIDYHFVAPIHLLVLFERGVRREGETMSMDWRPPRSVSSHVSLCSCQQVTNI